MTISQGTQFGPYRIVELIGSGGMGEVYRAQDTRLGREVAIKLVSDRYLTEAFGSGSPPPGSGTPATPGTVSHRRFLREAQSASMLNHSNICTIYDIGEEGGRPYLVMELLRGETLKDALRHGALSVTEVVTFSKQMASALAAAHAQGIVHRDIKPANIFVVGAEGKRQVKILDFGLAKQHGVGDLAESGDATATFAGQATAGIETIGGTATRFNPELTSPGSTLGTVAYMSPEQAEGQALDARTDLFSLGSVMFEMATGRQPFAGASPAGIFAALLKDPVPAVSVVRASEGRPPMPAGFAEIVAKLLVKDKAQRYQRATDVERDLEELGAGGSGMHAAASGTFAAASGVHPVAEKTSGGAGRLIAAGVIVLLLAGGGFAWWKHKAAPAPGIVTEKSTAPVAAAAKNAIIVADFVNQTGDPVFDATLNQALVVQLGQSPVMTIVSQRHLRQSLKFLGKKSDDVITPEIAREIGEREGIKAILTGTISNLGGDYVITLAAQNTATGDQIASIQTQAASKDKVLDALNQAASQMRAKLGESLDSIQKLNTPFGQATTPSLEAFRAYALGDAAHARGDDIPEAEGHYKRALTLDPKLAMAWARLGVICLNSGQTGKAMEYFTKAHELSADVSERERFYIEGHYYAEVIGDLNKGVETLEVAVQEYPLQIDNYINLAVLYRKQGNLDKDLELMLKGAQIAPDDAVLLGNLIVAYATNGQPAEAQKYLERAKQLKLTGTDILVYEMILDATKGDKAGMQKILAAGAGRPDQFLLLRTAATAEERWGQLQEARATFARAAETAGGMKATDAQAQLLLSAASVGWEMGLCQDVEGVAKRALELNKTKPIQVAVAIALSSCERTKPATEALDALEKKYPEDTLIQQLDVPMGRAALALQANQPQRALDLLQKSQGFDLVSPGPYLRGITYLQLKDAQNAIASFKIATAREFGSSPYALSLLGLGRAYAMAGDKANAKAAYDKFFAIWKDADPDLAVMATAKKEYAAL